MLFNILGNGDAKSILISLLLTVPTLMFALSLHETAHGYVAYKCGDNTAYNMGRLTLNPLKHLDPIGLICMMIFGFGWARPVPINTRNFRNPKRDMALSAAAGPLANLLLGVLSAILYGFLVAYYNFLYWTNVTGFLPEAIGWLSVFAELGALYNFMFAIFNLIPIPPFDGSRIFYAFLPQKYYFSVMRYERQIMFGLLIALLVFSRFGFSPFSWLTDKLFELTYQPFFKLFINIFSKLV